MIACETRTQTHDGLTHEQRQAMYDPSQWTVARQVRNGWELKNARAGVTFLVMWTPAIPGLLKVHSNTGYDVPVRKHDCRCECMDAQNGAKAQGRLCKHAAACLALKAHSQRVKAAKALEATTLAIVKQVATILSDTCYEAFGDVAAEGKLGTLADSIQREPTAFGMLLAEQLKMEAQYYSESAKGTEVCSGN